MRKIIPLSYDYHEGLVRSLHMLLTRPLRYENFEAPATIDGGFTHPSVIPPPNVYPEWHNLIADLPRRLQTLTFRQDLESVFSTMPPLSAAPPEFLPWAAVVLGNLTHLYVNFMPQFPGIIDSPPLPKDLQNEWLLVNERLGRKTSTFDAVYTFADMFTANAVDDERSHHSSGKVPYIEPTGGSETLYMSFVDMNADTSSVLSTLYKLAVHTNQPSSDDRTQRISLLLTHLLDAIDAMRDVFLKTDSRACNPDGFRPETIGKGMFKLYVPNFHNCKLPNGEPLKVGSTVSGLYFELPVLFDVLTGRKVYESKFG